MEYELMRKDDPIALMSFDEYGNLLSVSKKIMSYELSPLAYRDKPDGIKRWWNERSIPISRDGIASILRDKGITTNSEYLFKNLGLSLTDYYWIRPLHSNLRWKDVNLFDNDFKENVIYSVKESSIDKRSFSLSPNSSLQGDIEKSWIIRSGKRFLLKGNRDYSSEESINEVIASLVHAKQGYDNYVEYKLSRVKNKKYTFGCICEAFTNQNAEFVSAWDILTSSSGRLSDKLDGFIAICTEMGMNENRLRADLDYMIITDYLISNRDRHMNNIGILRDANSLQPLRLAPIYDSGKSMFVGMNVPTFEVDILNCETNSFYYCEKLLLQAVCDRSVVNLDKLPSVSEIRKLYEKDEKISERRIDEITAAYQMKAEYLIDWQKGK